MKFWEEQGKIKVAAPAKINLFLEILVKRQDGYHEIETVMQEVSLFDYLHIENYDKGVALTCSNPKLATGEENLVVKAVRLMQKKPGLPKGGKINLKKKKQIGLC